MKFVTLTMMVKERVTHPERQRPQELEHTGEDDGLVDQPHSTEIVPAEPTGPQYEIVESKPVTIGVDSIRNFYPRKDHAPGSRVILKSGVAYVVTEAHDEIVAKINALG
jgi:hypothetical protein